MRPSASPFRRFSLLLAVFLLTGSVLIGITAAWRVEVLLLRETVEDTYDAVNRHLKMFEASEFLEAAEATGTHAGHGQGEGEYEMKVDMVRAHFDLYEIRYAAFYDAHGTAHFSYVPGEVGQVLPGSDKQAFDQAMKGENWVDTDSTFEGHRSFRVALPVAESPGAAPVGVVILVRDINRLAMAIRGIQLTVGVVVLGVVLALYLSLRRVFLSATVQIRTKGVELERALRLVESTYDATLKALTAALDTRDSETEGHSQRVTAYTIRLAQEMGLTGQNLVNITRGALLHDVGKIGIPDSVLRKPGPLTPEEWALMRRHPTLGYEMLREIDFLRPALPVVLHHQEKYDGTGYPSGLKGDSIPLGARIFAVCDTLDAICSDRPYRPARSFAEARDEIVRGSGVQFDPAVVEAFLRVPVGDWQAIRASTCGEAAQQTVAAAL